MYNAKKDDMKEVLETKGEMSRLDYYLKQEEENEARDRRLKGLKTPDDIKEEEERPIFFDRG